MASSRLPALLLLLAGAAIGSQAFLVAPSRPLQLRAPLQQGAGAKLGSSSSGRTPMAPLPQQAQRRRGQGAAAMVDPSELWQGYMGLIDTYPLATKCATSAVIVPLGDLSAQAIEKFKARKAVVEAGGDPDTEVDGIDWARVLRFVIFGATLQPIWNHFYFQVRGRWRRWRYGCVCLGLFSMEGMGTNIVPTRLNPSHKQTNQRTSNTQWFDGLIPPPPTPFDLINVKKVLLDQFIQAPIFTVVIFAFLDVLEGKNWDGVVKQIKRDFWCVHMPACVGMRAGIGLVPARRRSTLHAHHHHFDPPHTYVYA